MQRPLQGIQANLNAQAQEVYALESIYGEENVKSHQSGEDLNVELHIPNRSGPHVTLKIVVPKTYPSSSPPTVHISAPFLSEDTIVWSNRELKKLYRPGEEENIMFTWVEWVKDQEDLMPPRKPYSEGNRINVDLGEKRVNEPLDKRVKEGQGTSGLSPLGDVEVHPKTSPEVQLIHGEPFTERKSTFQAHLAPIKSLQEVKLLMDVLLKHNKVQKATHNIMAYRIQNSNGIWLQDCDDDGESAAGARLLHLLQMTDAHNVLVVVSRWFGGVQLGPARFTHINNAARNLLAQQGFISADHPRQKKKGK